MLLLSSNYILFINKTNEVTSPALTPTMGDKVLHWCLHGGTFKTSNGKEFRMVCFPSIKQR